MNERPYLKSYQVTHDIDWFARYNGRLTHFASNGGLLPKCIRSKFNGEFLRFLLHLSELGLNRNCDVLDVEEQHLKRYLTIQTGMQEFSQEDLIEYRKSFRFFASLGCVSMDRLCDESFEDNRYFVVASPGDAILVDNLPYGLRTEYYHLVESLPELTNEIEVVE